MTRDDFIQILPDLIKDYQPLPEVQTLIGNIDLLMIIGATGVGKTAIIKRLGVPYVVTDTTRPIRPDEINGSDYFFRTDYEQLISEIKNRDFVQIAIGPAGDFYGTRASSYPEVGLAVYAIVADVIPQFRELGFGETTSAFIVPPTFSEWMDRMDRHGVERDQLQKRLKEAQRSFNFALNDQQTHFIYNENLNKAVEQTKALINGESDPEREAQARQAAQAIYQELSFV
jgi:guanylate kinase